MAVTNIGIYSYLSSGYALQEAPVAAIERQIDEIDRRVGVQEIIASEAIQQIESMDIAYREYVDNLYVRRAEQYKRDNAELRQELESQRDGARTTIESLEHRRSELEEAKVANAAKLGSIEHVAIFAEEGYDIRKIVAYFTILLMMGLDPAALLLVILFTHLLARFVNENEEVSPVQEPEEPVEDTPKKKDKPTVLIESNRWRGRKRQVYSKK